MEERYRQHVKWGESNHGGYKWMAILMEEVGELSTTLLDNDPSKAYQELTQVAAVAIAWLECLQRDAAKVAGGGDE
jgi:NTP pyrophosphatase (non-canonical NTP hydrolase)